MKTTNIFRMGAFSLLALICFTVVISGNVLADSSSFVLPPVISDFKVLPTSQAKLASYIAYDATNYNNSQDLQKDLSEASDRPVILKPGKLMANGDYVVNISPDGHYYLSGSINGFPVNFIVDTGADYCTVDASMARNLGIRAGMSITVDTANGQAVAGNTSGNVVTLPNVSLTNARVTVMEGLRSTLLGSEILNRLNINYGQGVMTISKVVIK